MKGERTLTGLIWASTPERAQRQLDDIVRGYVTMRIAATFKASVRNDTDWGEACFENGDCWKATVAAYGKLKGMSFNVIYDDREIDLDLFEESAQTITALPYQGHRMF